MSIRYLHIPLTTEKLEGLRRLSKAPDYNFQVFVDAEGCADYQQQILEALSEVLVQALIASDEELNGSRN